MLSALEASEVIRCVLLCMLEAVEGELCLLEVMCCALTMFVGGAGDAIPVGGDALRATLYAGGCGW